MPVPADQVLETFQCATEENQIDALRAGQVVTLGDAGEVWVTGDMHDHRRNFEKLLAAADIANHPQRHLVLHELIHGDHFDESGAEYSWRLLHQAAALKCDFPNQVHFLLANHDLAQIYGDGIMKAGIGVCEAFTLGIQNDFGQDSAAITVAITEFLLSLPLAIRTPGGVFICHSLPTDAQIENFDFGVFDRPLISADYKRRTGAVYQLVWGRHMSPPSVEKFAGRVGANIIISGHQPQESGYTVNGEHHLIVASDHNHGVFVPVDLARAYTMDELVGGIQKFVSLGQSEDATEQTLDELIQNLPLDVPSSDE